MATWGSRTVRRVASVAGGASAPAATQIPSNVPLVVVPSGAHVKLPQWAEGTFITVKNAAGGALTVYPFEAAGVTIEGAANLSMTATSGVQFAAIAPGNWSMIGRLA